MLGLFASQEELNRVLHQLTSSLSIHVKPLEALDGSSGIHNGTLEEHFALTIIRTVSLEEFFRGAEEYSAKLIIVSEGYNLRGKY